MVDSLIGMLGFGVQELLLKLVEENYPLAPDPDAPGLWSLFCTHPSPSLLQAGHFLLSAISQAAKRDKAVHCALHFTIKMQVKGVENHLFISQA